MPLVFSLLGDLFEPQKRAGIAAAVQVATGAGLALGQGIAGFAGAQRNCRSFPAQSSAAQRSAA